MNRRADWHRLRLAWGAFLDGLLVAACLAMVYLMYLLGQTVCVP